jgi:ribosome-binding factor A
VPDIDNKRPQRVAELLGHELASLISNELTDPRIGFVTVTEVRLSNDLRNARVYVSIYGDEEHRQASLEGLSKAAGYLRHLLGPKLQLRCTPELMFCHDESLDRADRLETLLRAVARGETSTPLASPAAPVAVQTDRSALADRRREFDEEGRKVRPPSAAQRTHRSAERAKQKRRAR